MELRTGSRELEIITLGPIDRKFGMAPELQISMIDSIFRAEECTPRRSSLNRIATPPEIHALLFIRIGFRVLKSNKKAKREISCEKNNESKPFHSSQ